MSWEFSEGGVLRILKIGFLGGVAKHHQVSMHVGTRAEDKFVKDPCAKVLFIFFQSPNLAIDAMTHSTERLTPGQNAECSVSISKLSHVMR